MVRRRRAQYRPQLRRQVGRDAGRRENRGPIRGRRRRDSHAHLRRAVPACEPVRERDGVARRWQRRSGRAVHADVPRAGRSVLCRHQRRRHRAAVVLRVWC